MTLFDELISMGFDAQDFEKTGGITLQNDGDGLGDYIAKWESSKPIPEGYKVGK